MSTVTDKQVRELAATTVPSLVLLRWSDYPFRPGADTIEVAHQRRMVSPRADGMIANLRPVGSDTLPGTAILGVPPDRAGGITNGEPLFAVETDGMLWSTTSTGARKAGLLEQYPQCSLAASTDGMDLVYAGIAVPVHEADLLERIAGAYHSKYGWPVTVTPDGAFDAPFGAPAAGGPPYRVYAFEPGTVWGFGTDDRYAARSTRWDFDRSA